jgi:hypothetical protein
VRPAIVAVPVRGPPALGSIASCTGPLLVPVAPDVTWIHGLLLADVQVQLACVVTFTVNGPPLDGIGAWSGEIANVQPSACATVNVLPAMVSVPDRAGPVNGAALKPTVPLLVPEAPDVMDNHDVLLLVAVQAQPLLAVTFTVPVPPAAGTFWLLADSAYEHPLPC